MIESWSSEETRLIWERGGSRRIPADVQRVALRKLLMINEAANLSDLARIPGNRLEKLSGNRVGQWSIRVNDQWRICFEWRENNAYGVEIVDYH